MAKTRVKKRTHTRPQNASAAPKGGAAALTKTPKSMVIRAGRSQVGTSVTQLVKDVRRMMEPDTAVRLKVRRLNLLNCQWPMESNHVLLGTQIQPIARLYCDDRSSRRYSFDAVFQV